MNHKYVDVGGTTKMAVIVNGVEELRSFHFESHRTGIGRPFIPMGPIPDLNEGEELVQTIGGPLTIGGSFMIVSIGKRK